MDFGEKYHHIYCDRYGNQYRISLRELEYTGESSLVECGRTQWLVDREGGDMLKLGGVYPTRATAEFISDQGFDLDELYTGQEYSYQLARLKNGTIDWVGFVVPDGFTEARWDDQRTSLSVQATDNLSILKGKQFADEFGENYRNRYPPMQTYMWVIKECLKKTGLLLPIWTMVDLKTLVDDEVNPVTQLFTGVSGSKIRTTIPVSTQRGEELVSTMPVGRYIRVTSGSIEGEEFEIVASNSSFLSNELRIVSVTLNPAPPISAIIYELEVFDKYGVPSLVLSIRGHFNDVDSSEIGIYKEGVNFDFIQTGDRLIIKDSEAGNDGNYEITGFISSTPPDSPYIRIQLSPQVPVTIHENVIIEITSAQSQDYPDPLEGTSHDIGVWIRDSNVDGKSYFEARGGAMTCWDVLDDISRQWGVKIQQNQGHWEVKRWNVDKSPSSDLKWFVYNSEGVQIGRQDFQENVLIPCKASDNAFMIKGVRVSMDRVLKYAVVNYKYKYREEGDTLQNLIVNGGFEGGINPAPRDWNVVRADNNVIIPAMVLEMVTEDMPPNHNQAVRIKNMANTRSLSNLTPASESEILKGDKLKISWWERKDRNDEPDGTGLGIYSIAIYESIDYAYESSLPESQRNSRRIPGMAGNKIFHLVNDSDGTSGTRPGGVQASHRDNILVTTSWLETGSADDNNRFVRIYTPSYTIRSVDDSGWREITIETGESPISGYLKFEVLGAAQNIKISGPQQRPERLMPTDLNIPNPSTSGGTGYRGRLNRRSSITASDADIQLRPWYPESDFKTLVVTGFFVGRILDPSNDAVPQIDPFMYPDFQAQLSRDFTDTISEIEVSTGDDYGDFADDKISGMWWAGKRTTMWDTWDGRFGWSRQGLITAKSVMEMYWNKTRLIDCELHVPDLNWSSRIVLESFPSKRFVMLRGAIGGQHDSFRGVLTEIHDDGAGQLPPGGNDGGNTVTPDWQPVGITRCRRDISGNNTGVVESVQRDMNPASPTYGQERWMRTGEDPALCPIGEPPVIMWGEQLVLDSNLLRTFPLDNDGDRYSVEYSNDGSDRYLRILHRADMGLVRSIIYADGDESISGWIYEPDVVIDGYTYKSMRLSWFVGTFTNLSVTFVIN